MTDGGIHSLGLGYVAVVLVFYTRSLSFSTSNGLNIFMVTINRLSIYYFILELDLFHYAYYQALYNCILSLNGILKAEVIGR